VTGWVLIYLEYITTMKKSIRMTLPKEIAEQLKIGEKDHVGFYENNRKIVIKKIE